MRRRRQPAWGGLLGYSPATALIDIDFRRPLTVVSRVPQTIAGTTTPQGFPSVGTFTRASAADWLNSAGTGLETQAASGALRREAVRGALIEEARTNIFLNSFAAATQTITVVNGTTYTVSRGTGAGTVTLSGALTGTPTQAVPVTGAAGSTSLTVTVSGAVAYVNVEAASTALSPISTAGGSVTRAADVLSVPVSGIAAGGDWTIAVIARPGIVEINRRLLVLDDGTSSNAFVLRTSTATATTAVLQAIAGGSTQATSNTVTSAFANDTRVCIALRRSGATQSLSVNGGAVDTVTPASLPSTALTTLRIGSNSSGTQQWNGFIERVIVFPNAVSDATLQSYSTLATWGG